MNARTEAWPRPHRLTVEDYYRMAEAGVLSPDDRVELIEGEIIDMAPIGSSHAAAVDLLAARLVRAVPGKAHVRIQAPLRVDVRSEPQPDLLLLKLRPDSYKHGHPTPEDVHLVIEVSDSTLRYDLEEKAALYARSGIPEYWVLDLVNRVLHRLREPSAGRYEEHESVKTGRARFDPLNVEVEIDDLF